ncbi:hypothetical protein FDP41_005294 [Naegleria fowleri]|uniref:Mitochondrial import inner membrane translocase subunit n=1 Tax=Naegleria fowleri TaxID=5763 RepID=A0A6A5BG53_NAEFO|nr:uncharacterized protein FDP41_005294 [Naegleria fowleri]KAF0975967.1 hypothetical protein FDP41_005294 [Naegleria fowleri]CAG4708075.1 unnamed protein product [Naegleria fowleri]
MSQQEQMIQRQKAVEKNLEMTFRFDMIDVCFEKCMKGYFKAVELSGSDKECLLNCAKNYTQSFDIATEILTQRYKKELTGSAAK